MLEKILQEIEAKGNIQFSSYTKPLIAVEDVVKIIRAHAGAVSPEARTGSCMPQDMITGECAKHNGSESFSGYMRKVRIMEMLDRIDNEKDLERIYAVVYRKFIRS